MKKKIILVLLFNGFLGISQSQVSMLKPTGIAEIRQNIVQIPTNIMYSKTLAWIEKKQLITKKNKTFTIKNEEIIIAGKARGIYKPINGGIKSVYDVNYILKIVFFYDHYILSYKFGHFFKNNNKLTTTPKDLFKKFNGHTKYIYKGFVVGLEKYIKSTNKSLLVALANHSIKATMVSEN